MDTTFYRTHDRRHFPYLHQISSTLGNMPCVQYMCDTYVIHVWCFWLLHNHVIHTYRQHVIHTPIIYVQNTCNIYYQICHMCITCVVHMEYMCGVLGVLHMNFIHLYVYIVIIHFIYYQLLDTFNIYVYHYYTIFIPY